MKAGARVLAVEGGRASLSCAESSACAACSGGRGCALRWLSTSRSRALEVPGVSSDGESLAVGQAVILEVADGALLAGAVRVYLLPLAGLLAGPLLLRFGWGGGEGMALLGAAAGLAVGWIVARRSLRRLPLQVTVSLDGRAVDR